MPSDCELFLKGVCKGMIEAGPQLKRPEEAKSSETVEAEYTLVLSRDPKTLRRLDKPEIFKYPSVDRAQEHASRLLKTLKQHDFEVLAPGVAASEVC